MHWFNFNKKYSSPDLVPLNRVPYVTIRTVGVFSYQYGQLFHQLLMHNSAVYTVRYMYIQYTVYVKFATDWQAGMPQSRQSAKLFLQSSGLGLPHPFNSRRVCPPPTLWSVGGGHTRLRERGWGSPNSDEGTYSRGALYRYFVRSDQGFTEFERFEVPVFGVCANFINLI